MISSGSCRKNLVLFFSIILLLPFFSSSVSGLLLECEHSCLFPDDLGDTNAETIGLSSVAEPSLQEILDDAGFDFNVVSDQRQYQLWHFGVNPDVNLMLEFIAAYAGAPSVFGYYLDGNKDTFTPLFRIESTGGSIHPGYPAVPVFEPGDSALAEISGSGTVGFAIDSYAPATGATRRFYTENALNSNSEDHAIVYESCNEYVIGFEDKNFSIADKDYQDAVVYFNVLSCGGAPFCGDGVVNQEWELCDGSDGVPNEH